MKRFILLLATLMGISSVASAQFYDSYNFYLYIEVGKTLDNSSSVYYVHFNGDGDLYCSSVSKSELRRLYNNGIIDEYAINKKHSLEYSSATSTSRYEVYKGRRYTQRTMNGIPLYDPYGSGAPLMDHTGYNYRAFSQDRSEMIMWNTSLQSNEAKNKKYYKRVDPDDLVPKEVKYDFL